MKYFDFWKKDLMSNETRDVVFNEAYNFTMYFGEFHVLEIGAARDLSESSRRSDGWSSVFWAHCVKTFGGSLTIVDIDEHAVTVAKELLSDFPQESISVECRDGLELLKNDGVCFNLIYLDGSDDPAQMLEQFQFCNRKEQVILCDDFNVKGKLLREYDKDFILYKWKNGHEMAIYLPDKTKKTVNVEEEL